MTNNELIETIEEDSPYKDSPISDESRFYALFQSGEVSSNEMAKRLTPMVKRVCRSVAQKFARRSQEFAVENLADDLYQEVMLNLITDTKRLYTPNKPIEPLLYQIARRKSGKSYVDIHTVAIDMSEDMDEVTEHSILANNNEEYNPDLVDVVDREHAKERIRRVMLKIASEAKDKPMNNALQLNTKPFTVDMSLKIEHASVPLGTHQSRPKQRPNGKQPQYILSADQVELTKIMDSLAYLQGEFASLLGLQKPTLASYLYGRTASVPVPVMDRARVQLNDKVRLGRIARYHANTMHMIVTDWMKQLGNEVDYSKQGLLPMAEFLGIHLVSLERWISGTIRPKVNVFLKHDMAVEREAARRKTSL